MHYQDFTARTLKFADFEQCFKLVINLSPVLPCKTSGSSTLADFNSADPRGLLSNNLDTMATIKNFASLLNFEYFSLALLDGSS